MKTLREMIDLIEGINDPAIFKIVFLIGGPGSGKGYISKNLGLQSLGYVPINSDTAFEFLMSKNNLDFKMPDSEEEKRNQVRDRAKQVTASKIALAVNGRLGIVIDGTGDNFDKVIRMKAKFDELGYNNFVVIVNTDFEVARQRNQLRTRTVPDDVISTKWHAAHNNMGKFANAFENAAVIDNSGDDKTTQDQIATTYKKLVKFTSQAPNKNPARSWIQSNKL
jgi:predicted kinase